MKHIVTLFLLLTSFISFAQTNPEIVISPIDHLFVPQGFDNNDNVEVVVTGHFPNPCYSINKINVEVLDETVHVTVTALKKEVPSSELCEPLSVPFKEEVTIGNLQAGNYNIIVNGKTPYEHRQKMEVAISDSNSVDDHLYPIVEYVELGFTGGLSGDAVLFVKVPSDCVVFDRVEYLSNNKDTLSVLPILKKISTDCNSKQTRIEIPVKFKPYSFTHKDVLLYVRSIEGKSVNTIVHKN